VRTVSSHSVIQSDADHPFIRAETVERLKEKYDRELAEEEDEKAMGRDFTTRLGPFVEVRESRDYAEFFT
jgi:hypothetical protein